MFENLTVLGMVGIKLGRKRSGCYLQAKSNGELHASNEERHEEETWFLVEIDKAKSLYAFVNWKNGRFLSANKNGCAWADSVILSGAETWEVGSGKPAFANAYSLRSFSTGHYLGANDPGDDFDLCHGEVGCGTGASQPIPPVPGNKEDNGWWVFEPADRPTKGDPSFGDIAGVVIKIIPVAIEVIKALAK